MRKIWGKLLIFICAVVCCSLVHPMSAKADDAITLYKGDKQIGQYTDMLSAFQQMKDSSADYTMKIDADISTFAPEQDYTWPKVGSIQIQGDNTYIFLEETHILQCNVTLTNVNLAVGYEVSHVINLQSYKLTLQNSHVGYRSSLESDSISSRIIGAKGSIVEVIGGEYDHGILECATEVDKVILKNGRLWFYETAGEYNISQLEIYAGEVRFGQIGETRKCKVTIGNVISYGKSSEISMEISNYTELQIGEISSSTGTSFPLRLTYFGKSDRDGGKVSNSSVKLTGTMKNVSEIIIYPWISIQDKNTSLYDMIKMDHAVTAPSYQNSIVGEYYYVNYEQKGDIYESSSYGYGDFSLSQKSGAYYVDYNSFRGIHLSDAVYYMKNGKLDSTYNGFFMNYLMKNGKHDADYMGIYTYNGEMYWVVGGIQTDVNGVYGVTDTCRTGYYLVNGKVDTSYTGLCPMYEGGLYDCYYYVEKGIACIDYEGLAKYNNAWYYVGGMVWQKFYTGLVKHNGSWFYVKNGKVDFSYTGLCKYNGSWYYVEKGVLNWKYTGLCKYGSIWYYVEKGVLNWKYTGYTKYGGSRWYVKKGVMVRKA